MAAVSSRSWIIQYPVIGEKVFYEDFQIPRGVGFNLLGCVWIADKTLFWVFDIVSQIHHYIKRERRNKIGLPNHWSRLGFSLFILDELIIHSQLTHSQLTIYSCGLMAQCIKHCTGIARS